jgi:brefeldin A-resistance guanine nucleotide exchange factor 1
MLLISKRNHALFSPANIYSYLGIARLCCDPRRTVRSSALGCLQQCVLLPELHILSSTEWESVFNKVLFPLLIKLIETTNINDYNYGIEETRVRVSQLLCRIFLQHLTPLLTLSTFTTLWLTILDFMDKYSKIDQPDTLVGKLFFREILIKYFVLLA